MNWIDKKEEIRAWIEKNQPEVYWDYRDELSDKDIAKIIEDEDGLSALEDEIWEMNIDHIADLERQCIKNVAEEFDFDEDILDDDEFVDFCNDNISVDLNISDLLDNCGKVVLFYDSGIELQGYGQERKEYIADMDEIKKFLKIKISDTTHDEKIMQMILQASYGGQLVVYFTASIKEFLEVKENSAIKFNNVNIAIIDTCNGSGDDCFIPGVEFTVPFDRSKIFYDKSIKYNYSFAVCGMSSDWCRSTQWAIIEQKGRSTKTEGKSPVQKQKEYDRSCDKVFKQGGCTFGDMDITRHRDIFYRNDFPCGSKCPHCGTFWID